MNKSIVFILIYWLSQWNCFAAQSDARQVFNKLVMAIGNYSVPKPVLLILDNELLVAKTFPNGDIMLGKQFIKYCSRFGKDSVNALACVLSHELVHYYQKHFWAQKYGSAYVDSDWGKKIAEDEASKKYLELYETQADQLGFYYAFSAGYKTWQVARQLLDSTYKWYHLKDSLTGYPPLAERKTMAQTSASKIAALIPVFEMSNHLKVISATYVDDQQSALLDFSVFGYEHLIAANIQTAEMFNNIAVSKILKAQKYSASVFSGLQLPVILDQSSLMYEASGTKGDDEQEKFNTLMTEALENLEKALQLDEKYWPASINKSLVLLGQEKYGSCEDELNSQAIKNIIKSNKTIEPIISEIKAILTYLKGDIVKSKEYFKSAKKSGSVSAEKNELILMDKLESESHSSYPGKSLNDTIEKWNNKSVYKGLKSYNTSTDHVINYHNTKAELLLDSMDNYMIFELRQKIGFCPVQYVKIAACKHPSTVTSRGLKTGAPATDLISRYGKCNTKVLGTLYNYWIYPGQNIVVSVNQMTGKVDSWFYYMLD